MALRVLLADESSTIKRVMQLALQDFGVEVKSVPVGLDVLAVTKTFKPDIVFADVLLAKRNGYDVCLELKSDGDTRHIPVILMWSGFMEVDEARIAQAHPDGRLEKPFDSETLRNLVQQMVPKTQSNPVSSFLQFPKMPEFTDERPKAQTQSQTQQPTREPAQQNPQSAPQQTRPSAPAAPSRTATQSGVPTSPTRSQPAAPDRNAAGRPAAPAMPPQAAQNERPLAGKIPTSAPLNFDTLSNQADEDDVYSRHDDLPLIDNPDMDPESELLVAMDEDFATVPLQPAQQRDQHEEDGWTQQDLKKFKIQVPEENPEFADNDFATRFVIPQDELANAHVEVEGEFEEISFGDDLPSTQINRTNPNYAPESSAPKSTPTRGPSPQSSVNSGSSPSIRVGSAGAGSGTHPNVTSPSISRPPPTEELRADNPALIERVIREEAREVIENICWKVIPEMVERIVREEINKILRETEKSL